MLKDKAKLANKINEVCKPYCNSEYCLLKEIICSSHNDFRFLVQLKCLEIFKWNLSQKEKREVELDEAHETWVASGMAKFFAEYYTEDTPAQTIYDRVEDRAIREGTYVRENQ